MTVAGNIITVSDFNSVRNNAVEVISTGNTSFGYGQITFSPPSISIGTTVTPGYLNQLRNDLFNARAHQIGTAPAIAETAQVGNIITATDIATFKNYSDIVIANRFTAHPTRMGVFNYGSQTRTASWSSQVSAGFTIAFQSSNFSRWFWNAGGLVRITSSRTGGSATSQNTSWSNLLSGAGAREYGAATIYSLPQSPTTVQLFSTTATAPYASNTYTISARSVGAPGGANTAGVFEFLLTWTDPYVDPGPPDPNDVVDGTLSYSVELIHPVGGAALSGGGQWRGFSPNGINGQYPLPGVTFGSINGS
jgi:hypothetical protein